MKSFSYLKDVTTLKLEHAACIGCGRCLEVCPHQVFSLAVKKASISERDACMECGACALNCPAKAISVDAGVGCATGLIREWLQERKLRAPGGSCCS
jgi:NAD-dependent dihydropyrimidine dehydrogenase PreA subunit